MQLRADLAAHAPDFFHQRGGQHVVQVLGRQGGQVAHLGQLGRIAAWFALCRLGDVVGQLSQCLGVADAAGDAYSLVDAGADSMAAAGQVSPHALQTDE